MINIAAAAAAGKIVEGLASFNFSMDEQTSRTFGSPVSPNNVTGISGYTDVAPMLSNDCTP